MSQPVDRNIIVREILKRSNLDPDDMLDIMAEIGNITPLFQEIQNAEKAVKNQLPITFTTPDTLYTALSLPQALSESDVPIATMNVT